MENITRLLLIEDDKDDQLFFRLAVADIATDIYCDIANNGSEGLRKLQTMKQFPDLVFLDLNMPIMHGFECLQKMKNMPELRSIPVIIFSTSNSETDIKRAMELGASGYLNKPNDNAALSLKLQEIFAVDFKKAKFYM